jgi:hypothetical protein
MERGIRVSPVVLLLFLSLFIVTSSLHAQTANGQVGGLVQDVSKALVPGVTVTLKNNETGISTTQVTNESGAYSFLSVPPGTYSVSGSLPGFKTAVTNNVVIGVAAQVRLNITLEVGALDAKVEVSVTADQILTESAASVGDVLTSKRALDLPLVGNDILDLVKILPGYRLSPGSVPGVIVTDTFAGQGLDTVNVTRDGLSVTSGRYSPTTYGLSTTTNINPELVGEIRLILSPVDAELGRGNSQIQISTRSGTNRYTGSAVWQVQNTALNANTWANNKNVTNGVWSPTQPDWRNNHDVTLTYGGPVIRNKTFFFVAWEQQTSRTRQLVTANVWSDAARNGIFRYWEKWNPLNGNPSGEPATYPQTAASAQRPSVDFSGNPLRPTNNPDGTAYTGKLVCFSVFNTVKVDGTPFTPADCPGGTISTNTTSWDPLRLTPDSTGYIAKVMKAMPKANYYLAGDGLNTAGFRWVRPAKGDGNGANANNATVGIADYVNRKQINIKIDQNFGAKHRVSGNYSYQSDFSDAFMANWPGGINGENRRTPQVLTISGTSTLSSTMLNEARFGFRREDTGQYIPLTSADNAVRDAAAQWYHTGGTNSENNKAYPVAYNLTSGVANGALSIASQNLGNKSPLYNFADTFSWAHSRHSFKFGGEIRLTLSTARNSVGGSVLPTLTSGAATGTTSPLSTASNFTSQLTDFLATGRTNASNLLYFMNGSVASASQLRWIDDSSDVTKAHWEDTTTVGQKFRQQRANEWSVFWKDDWKLTNNLTVNLGLRYDFYQSPYIGSGFTTTAVGQGIGLFANSYDGKAAFDNWLLPGSTYLTGYGNAAGITSTNALQCSLGVQQSTRLPVSTCDPNKLTTIEFVGPNTPNPSKHVQPQDGNNFGPAIGFAWQVPWFGAGKTTIRGGYQVTYNGSNRDLVASEAILGGAPGATLSSTTNTADPDIAAILATRALNLQDIPTLVPVRPTINPGQTLPVYGRYTGGFEGYDPNYRTPYTQNLTLQVTRSVARNMTLDARYVGTLGRKMETTLNINTPAIFSNKELMDALDLTRAGGNSPLFDQMFAGLNVSGQTTGGYGAVGTCVAGAPAGASGLGKEGCAANQVMQHGSAHLRRSASFTTPLANGNYFNVINALANLNTVTGTGLQPLPTGFTGANARVLRNGCDRIANNLYNPAAAASATNIPTRCFPEDYFYANPQFGTANPVYHANMAHNNFHSMQLQYTLRPTQGTSFQSTYTWQKNLTDRFDTYVDPRNRAADYSLDYTSIAQEFRTNGTFEIPVGPNRLVFGNSSGWFARAIERWQTSIIYSWSGGPPRDAYANQFLYAATGSSPQPRPLPSIVGPWKALKTDFKWNGPSNNSGTIFGYPSPFVTFRDPQCANIPTADSMGFNLQTSCVLNGLAAVAPAGTPGAVLQADNVTYAVPVLVNPMPGNRGNLRPRALRGIGRWTLDGNIGKTFRINESKSVQIRFDATNILNHPLPADPQFSMQSADFGRVTGDKTNSRRFQGQLRLSF